MAAFFIISFFVVFYGAYFYFGYYQDYKRNPKEFKRSVVGLPLALLSSKLGNKALSEKLKKWANLEDELL